MTLSLFDPATQDLAALALVHAAAFPDGWTRGAIGDLLATPGTFCFVASEAPPRGFVIARAAGGEAEILTIAVLPAARGEGIGRALIQAAAARARDLGAQMLFLEVGDDNPPALALYAGLGFVKVGARKGYYGEHGHATVMKSPLPLPQSADFA